MFLEGLSYQSNVCSHQIWIIKIVLLVLSASSHRDQRYIQKHGVESTFGAEPWSGVVFGVEILSGLRWLRLGKYLEKWPCFTVQNLNGTCSNFWFGLVWRDFVKLHSNFLDGIIFWTNPGQVDIFSNSQKVQFYMVREDWLVYPNGAYFSLPKLYSAGSKGSRVQMPYIS